LLVHRRSESKDVWPGWCDIAVGGVVASGESYEAAVERELREEMGVSDVSIVPIDDGVARSYDDEEVRLIGRCFVVEHRGPFHFADGEVAEAWWVALDAVDDLVELERFLPDSLSILWPRLRPST
jgi:ADP-ribose pyrophosphatase YjhB (NUDIX family)